MACQRRSCTSIVALLLLLILEMSQPTAAGVMDNVNDGLKLAGQMFGINTAADVANLVAKAFSKATSTTTTRQKPDLLSVLQQGFLSQRQQQQHEEEQEQEQDEQEEDDQYAEEEQQQSEQTEQENAQESPPVTPQGTRRQRPPTQFSSVQMLTNMMRMIGFDPRKLGALAINAIVMIAQAIGSTIVQATRGGNGSPATGPDALFEPSEHQPRALASGSPIDWFLKRPGGHTQRMLRRIMDRQLPEHVVDMLAAKESGDGNEAACLKLLMCKSSPIIWGMQKSLRKRLAGEPEDHDPNVYMNADMFFKYLPSLHEYKEHGVECETRFGQHCPTNITMEEL